MRSTFVLVSSSQLVVHTNEAAARLQKSLDMFNAQHSRLQKAEQSYKSYKFEVKSLKFAYAKLKKELEASKEKTKAALELEAMAIQRYKESEQGKIDFANNGSKYVIEGFRYCKQMTKDLYPEVDLRDVQIVGAEDFDFDGDEDEEEGGEENEVVGGPDVGADLDPEHRRADGDGDDDDDEVAVIGEKSGMGGETDEAELIHSSGQNLPLEE